MVALCDRSRIRASCRSRVHGPRARRLAAHGLPTHRRHRRRCRAPRPEKAQGLSGVSTLPHTRPPEISGAAGVVNDRQTPFTRTSENTSATGRDSRVRRWNRECASCDRSCCSHRLVAVAHQRPRISVGETPRMLTPVTLDQRPQAIGCGIIQRAVIKHHGRAEQRHARKLPTAPSSSPCRSPSKACPPV